MTQAPPFVLADGSKTKNGNVARQYIRPQIANELKALASQKLVRAKVFDLPERWEVADMFRADPRSICAPVPWFSGGSRGRASTRVLKAFQNGGNGYRWQKRPSARNSRIVPVGATHCIMEG